MQDKLKLKNLITAGIIALAALFGALVPTATYATDCACKTQSSDNKSCLEYDIVDGCTIPGGAQAGIDATKGSFGTRTELTTTVTSIINGILYVIGILAVVMVIIGGIQYTTSGGDSAAVTKAKNTILYGIVGLVIALLAYAIVNFVITRI
ncbi:hypothetical protein IJF89_01835 [Candidatus Saccharibacteria bacterium]|nr:hypothetical protein [Candidatus Saccharibacteria bacterium]